MVRSASDARTDDEDRPIRMTWDGTKETARKIIAWSMNGDLITRFSWSPRLHEPDEARTLVERDYPNSPEWRPTPVGTVIERTTRADDAPLRLHLPEKADPIAVLEET